jgi:hypothetical protein
MDVSRLRRGEQIAGVSGVALLLIMFIFSWFSIDLGLGGDAGFNAWESFGVIDIVLFLTALAGIALAILAITQSDVDLPVAMSAIATGLGVLAVLLVLFRIISPPDFGAGDFGLDIDADRSIGVFLGFLAALGVAVGGWMAMQEEGAAVRTTGTGTGTGGTAPPPPPPPSSTPPAGGGPTV